jgi:alpha-maltose-1-phosphate synthase
MKIAFLTIEYPHTKTYPSGGIGTSIFNLANGIVKAGHEVIILAYGQDKDEIIYEDGITIYKIENIAVKGFSFFLTQLKLKRIINKLYKDKKIDIVEAVDWSGITAFVTTKCPIVIKLHGSDTYFCSLEKRKVKWSNAFYENKALHQCNGIISVSQYTADITKQLFDLHKDATVIPNAINTLNFESSKQESNNVILYFGTLIRKKGLLELPLIFNKVYAQNQKAQLVLIGHDTSDTQTKNASTWHMMIPLFDKEAFKNVTYLGAVPYNEMKTQIEKASLCVFPTFAEALPVSWLEAMAMQKPIVASNIGWAKEMIDDGKEGFLVHPAQHDLFAEKVLQLLDSKALQADFGINARNKVIKRFSLEVIVKQSINYYDFILANKEKD